MQFNTLVRSSAYRCPVHITTCRLWNLCTIEHLSGLNWSSHLMSYWEWEASGRDQNLACAPNLFSKWVGGRTIRAASQGSGIFCR